MENDNLYLPDDWFDEDEFKPGKMNGNYPEPSEVSGFITASEIIKIGPKEVPKLWKPFLNKVGLAGFVGSSDCGKSTLMRQLTLSIALREEEFLGYPLSWEHGRAMYICTEDNLESISPSLQKQIPDISTKLDNLKFLFVESSHIYKQVEEELSKCPVDLIVLDTWSDLYKGNANQFNEIRSGLTPLKNIANKFKCCVVIIHHTIKNSENSEPNKNRVNGSQAIEATLRSVLELRNIDDGKSKCLSVIKGNYISADFKRKGLKLDFDEEHLLFSTEHEGVDFDKMGQDRSNRKYSNPEVFKRLCHLKKIENRSYVECRKTLALEFGEMNVPELTQLKTIYKGMVSQSEPKDTDQPTNTGDQVVDKSNDELPPEEKSDQTLEDQME
jgi:RecA-family ATPase